jgi:hypothetical protein
MGNINNVWYLKDSGGDWASSKCELDDCYSIPYKAEEDENLYLQADIPDGYNVEEVWLADPDGNRVQELLAIAEWTIVSGVDIHRLIFKVPHESYACNGVPTEQEICVADLESGGLPAYHAALVSNYVNGLQNTTMFLYIGGVYYNVDGPLPPGYVKLGPTTFQIPCELEAGDISWQAYSDIGNGNSTWPYTGEIWTDYVTVYEPFECFRFEVPLLVDGVEEATLVSEPFHCPMCEPTVKISSDYCLAKTDIFGTFIFDTDGMGDEQLGTLTKAKNDLRIQAVLKQLPSSVNANRNVRCNNFRAKLQQRYKLQGAMPTDFPDYMVNMIESVFSGKKIFIDGEEYIPESEQIFIDRNVAGRSMKKLDVDLVKCERSVIFDCTCVETPPNCEEDPIEYSGIVFCTTAPDQGYGVDRSIWRFSIDMSALSGGQPPYSISDWQAYICQGTIAPDSTFQPWNDNNDSNFYRRATSYDGDCRHIDANSDGDFDDPGDTNINAGCGCLSVLVKITDARGCEKILGNTVDIDDLRCVGQSGDITVDSIGSNSITLGYVGPLVGGATFDLSFDWVNYPITGINTLPYTVGGLSPNTQYSLKVRVNCGTDVRGYIGPLYFTTLP